MVLSPKLSAVLIARRERLQLLLEELNVDSVVATDAVNHNVIAIVSRRVDAFALDDNDIGHTTFVEHRIETRTSSPFRERESSTHSLCPTEVRRGGSTTFVRRRVI